MVAFIKRISENLPSLPCSIYSVHHFCHHEKRSDLDVRNSLKMTYVVQRRLIKIWRLPARSAWGAMSRG